MDEDHRNFFLRNGRSYGSATVGCSFYTSACLRHQIREGEVFYVKKTHRIKFNYPSFVYLGTKKDELSLVKMM